MTENPLYRRVYGYDNPLMQQPIFRPPSEAYPRTNLNPNAAQDLRNLFGTFFTPNYTTQYQPSPYQTPPTSYNSYATNNISPAQQEINQRIGDALHSYTPPREYSPQYQPPRYSTYYRDTPQVNYNANAAPEARNAMYDFAVNNGLDALNILWAGGGLRKGIGAVIKPQVPYALARLQATRYGKPIVDGINRFAETPVGKFVGKIADFIW